MPPAPRVRNYKRSYQACIACRERKVRCNLGESDAPHPPPCARCKREQRECLFAGLKRASKTSRKGTESHSQARSQSVATDPRPNSRDHSSRHNSLSHDDVPSAPRFPSSLADAIMYPTPDNDNETLNVLFGTAIQPEETTTNQSDSGPKPTNDQLEPDGQGHTASSPDAMSPGTSRILMKPAENSTVLKISSASNETLNLWNSCRFVRMGWFAAYEALTLVDAFFRNLGPLTLLLSDYYADHANHRQLLSEEPFLATVILMISARYHVLPGPCAAGRNFAIHARLWNHCESLLLRVILGQYEDRVCNLRGLGTIEGLLLLTEWHSRGLHHPPPCEGFDAGLLVEASPRVDFSRLGYETVDSLRWQKHLAAPIKRSARSSWMVFGCAVSLAHDIGIFDAERAQPVVEVTAQHQSRCVRLRTAMHVLGSQLSSRVGCAASTQMVDYHGVYKDFGSYHSDSGNHVGNVQMTAWVELNKLSATITDTLYHAPSPMPTEPRKRFYSGLCDHFNSILGQWRDKFSQDAEIDPRFLALLTIDYHRLRIHVNAFGLQAPLERFLANRRYNPNYSIIQQPPVGDRDQNSVQEVVDGACAILSTIVELAHSGTLKYCPVRTFSAMLSTSMLLIATLHLGRPEGEENIILGLMDSAVSSLQKCHIDDLHVGVRIGTLLDIHARKLRAKSAARRQAQSKSMDDPALFSHPSGTDANGYLVADHDQHEQSLDFDSVLADANFGFLQELSDDVWGFPMPRPFATLHDIAG